MAGTCSLVGTNLHSLLAGSSCLNTCGAAARPASFAFSILLLIVTLGSLGAAVSMRGCVIVSGEFTEDLACVLEQWQGTAVPLQGLAAACSDACVVSFP